MAVNHSLVALKTPLKEGELVLRDATYTEELGMPFEIVVELLSTDDSIQFERLLGKTMMISLETEAKPRYFHGIITAFSQCENEKRISVYKAVLRPWFWLLTLSQKCRIYQQKSYPEIIKSLFNEIGFTDFEDKLTSKYPKQEYVVQFNETDFDFVTRIMQQEGIFYTFEHDKNKHTLVLQDDNVRLKDIGKIDYVELDENTNFIGVEGIREWNSTQQIKTGGFSLGSYDFEAPTKKLKASTKDPQVKPVSSLNRQMYDGQYCDRKHGEQYTKLLMERENAGFNQTEFSGDQRTIFCGARFSLIGHIRDDQNADYLVTKYSCTIRSDELVKEEELEDHTFFKFSATAIPAKVNYRPAQTKVQPKMTGPQTAVVVGKKKEEIWTDKYGRVKVQFHWDEESDGDDKSSCWVRVSQSMAGKNWGSIYIPRVGQEVLVDFLQGDPNQPIIVGCVFNGKNLPPYPLPKHATMSGFRSKSTKNAGTFNEIRFEDQKGEEQLFIHASKNKDESVTHDSFETVGANRHLTINKNQHTKVKHDSYENVGDDKIQQIGKDFNLLIEGKEAKEVRKSISLTVKGNGSEDYEGNLSINVDKDSYIKSDNICLEAKDNLTLKVGSSFVAIERGGISISTPGKLEIKSQSSVNVKAAAKLDLSAAGPASIKGAMVKVN